MSIMSYFDINHTLRSIFGEEFSMNLSRLLGSERINVYSGQSKQSEFTHDLCHLFGMHQGRCCHEPIVALLDFTLVTLNNQRSICSMYYVDSSASTKIVLNLQHFDKIYLQSFDTAAPF